MFIISVSSHIHQGMSELHRELAEDWRFGNQTYTTSGSGLLSDLGQILTPYLLDGRDNASFPTASRSADEMHHFENEGNTSVLM